MGQRRFLLACLLIIGCGNDELTSCSGDAGVSDLASASCCQLAVSVRQFIDERSGCDADSDCITTSTGCGLAYQCGIATNTTANDPYLEAMVRRWDTVCVMGCIGAGCPSIPRGRKLICQTSTCQAIDP